MIICTHDDVTDEHAKEIAAKTGKEVTIGKIATLSDQHKEQAEILITYGNYDDSVFAEELAQLPRLKWVQALSAGTEQLPLAYMEKHGILLTSAKGVHAIPISEYVLGMVLHFAKKVDKFQFLKQRMVWGQSEEMFEVHGKTIGILGTGSIGSEIALKARAFGMKPMGVNSNGRSVDGFDQVYALRELDQLLPLCDYVCAVLPSSPETRDLIDARRIALMKDGGVFINVGRGDLVVEEDLYEALRTSKLRGAALDVFRDEPLPYHHSLWQLENLIITPHASAKTNMYVTRALDIFLQNYNLFQAGQQEGLINQVGYGQLETR